MSSPKSPESNPSQNADGANFHQIFVIGEPKKSKAKRNVFIAGGAVGLVGIGTTLAANINLNSGQNIEYGQGIQITTKCDADGFKITPHTEYDNAIGTSRLTDIKVSGLNLNPVGSGFDAENVTGGPYESIESATAAHPGEYFDTDLGEWTRTCDGVVLDFRAYTNSADYAAYTLDNYNRGTASNSYGSPVMWSQIDGNNALYTDTANPGIAVKIKMNPDYSVFNVYRGAYNISLRGYNTGYLGTFGVYDNTSDSWVDLNNPTQAKYSINFEPYAAPRAETISKISVSTSAEFPSDYVTTDWYN
jgi:hypothetical protein